MRHHEVKSHPEAYALVMMGIKMWEFRLNDRDYRAGDLITLQEWDPAAEEYVGAETTRIILHVSIGEIGAGFPLFPGGFCILSLGVLQT